MKIINHSDFIFAPTHILHDGEWEISVENYSNILSDKRISSISKITTELVAVTYEDNKWQPIILKGEFRF